MPEWGSPKPRRSWADSIGKPSRKARGKRDYGSGCAVLVFGTLAAGAGGIGGLVGWLT